MFSFHSLLARVLRSRSSARRRRGANKYKARTFSPRLECLEERRLLAGVVTESQTAGVLTINDIGGDDTIVVNSSGGATPDVLVSVNGGAAASAGAAGTVTSISVTNAGPTADTIDLTGVSDASGYTSVTAVTISDTAGDTLKLGGMQFAATQNVAVTASAASGSLTVDATGGTGVEVSTLGISDNSINLSGNILTTSGATTAQNYSGAVTLNGATNLVSNSSSGGGISFSSTISGTYAFTTNSAGTTSFNDSVSGLASLSITGPSALANAGALTINTNGSQTYNGEVTFNASSTTFSAGTGSSITFDASIDGPSDGSLAINAPSIDLNGGSIGTDGGSETYTGNVTLGAALTISTLDPSTPSGAVSFNDPIAASVAGVVLTINAEGDGIIVLGEEEDAPPGGAVTLVGTSSTGPALGGLSINTGGTPDGVISLSGTFTTSGSATFDGPVTLTGDTTVVSTAPSGGNITFGSTVGGQQALTLQTDGTVALDGAVGGTVGGTTELTTLVIQGNSTPTAGTADIGAGAIITTFNEVYNNAVVLTSNIAVTSSGTVKFGASVNAAQSGAESLSVNAGGIDFFGQVGATPLSTFTTAGGGATGLVFPGSSAAPSVATIGSQTYNNPVFLDNNTVLDVIGQGDLLFQSSVVSGPFVGHSYAYNESLTADVNGTTTFGGSVGGTSPGALPLGSLNITTHGPFALGSAGPNFPFQAISVQGSISITVDDQNGQIATSDSLAINPNVELSAATGSISLSAGDLISAGAGSLISAPEGTVNFTTGYGSIPTGGTILGGSILLDDTWGGDIVADGIVVSGQNSGGATSTSSLNAVTMIVQSASGGSPAPSAISVDAASQTISNYGAPILSYSGIEDVALEPLEATAATYNLNLYAMQGNHSLVVEGPTLEAVPSGAPAPTPTALNPVFYVTAPEDFNDLQMYAGAGDDVLENLTNTPSLLAGGSGSDTLVGGSNMNVIFGGSGTESIYGGDGTSFTSAGEPQYVNYIFADYAFTPGRIYNPNSAPANPTFAPAISADISVHNGHNLIESLSPGVIAGTTSTDTTITSEQAATPFLLDAETALEPPTQNMLTFTLSAPPLMLQNGTLTVTGTTGNDSIGVVFTEATDFTVSVGNSVSQAFSTSTVKSVVIDAGGGIDTTSVTLPANSSAELSPGVANITASNFSLSIIQSSSIYLIGNSSSTATVTALGGATVSMSSTFTSVSVGGTLAGFLTGFSTVAANSYGAGDVAYLYGAAGVTNTLGTFNQSSTMSGSGYSNTANYFPTLVAVAGSNGDTATLGDSPLDPGTFAATLQASPVAAFFGSDFDDQVFGFNHVTAYAQAGTETASLNDATGGGVYSGGANSGTVTDSALDEVYAASNAVSDFKQVYYNGLAE